MSETRSRILIVHHDERALMNLEHVLEAQGFATTTAWNTNEALLAIAESCFKLVLIGDRSPLIRASQIVSCAWSKRANLDTGFLVVENHPTEAALLDEREKDFCRKP